MSEKSIKHLEVLAKVREKKISQKDAAKILKSRVLELVTCEKYEGLGPSFMNEKLSELHSVTISTEAVRQLMIEVLRKNWGSIEEVRNTSIIIWLMGIIGGIEKNRIIFNEKQIKIFLRKDADSTKKPNA